jgi:hypothetical protein
MSVVIALASYFMAALIIFVIAIIILLQRNTYLIPKKPDQAIRQVEKTLEHLGVPFQKNGADIMTKATHIKIMRAGLVTFLLFAFEEGYNDQGAYLAGTVVKYQRYETK